MNQKETLEVFNLMVDESSKAVKERAARLLNTRGEDWDFDQFGDRNTFARVMFEVLVGNEITQYKVLKHTKKTALLAGSLRYENCGV